MLTLVLFAHRSVEMSKFTTLGYIGIHVTSSRSNMVHKEHRDPMTSC